MLKKRNQLLAVFCIITLVLPGCTQKQTLVSAPQKGKNPYHRSSPKSLSDQIRSVFKTSEINRWAKKQAGRNVLLERYPELEPLLAQTERDPSDLVAKRKLADFLAEKHLYRRALEFYSELAATLPDDAEVQLALGQIWDELGAHAIALRHTINAAELNPECESAMTLLGVIYLHRDEPERAAKAFAAVLSRDPENAIVLANAGFAFLQLKQWQTAADHLERAVRINPSSSEARNNLGIVKAYLGDEEGAIKEFLQVSKPAIAYNNLGAAYLAQKEWDRARDAFQAALAWDSEYVKARLNLLEAESYLPPPSVVNLAPFATRFAWLSDSWKRHQGISSDGIFNVSQRQLFPSLESLDLPLRQITVSFSSTPSVELAQTPAESIEKQLQSVESEILEDIQPTAVSAEGTEQASAQVVALSDLDPFPFAVRDSAEIPASIAGEGSLESLMASVQLTTPKAELAPPVGIMDRDMLLSNLIETPVPSLGWTRPSPKKNQSLEQVSLAGGDLLSMLVTRPAFDWTSIAQVPEAHYEGLPAQTSEATAADPGPRFYPAQVWLLPSNVPVSVPVGTEIETAPLAQPALDLRALNRNITSPRLPFQILSVGLVHPIRSTLQSQVALSTTDISARPQERLNQSADPDPVLELARVESETRGELGVAVPGLNLTELRAPYTMLSFDQFAAVRKQILSAQLDPSESSPVSESAEMAVGVPVQTSGLAGIAGMAFILFSFGATRLYLRSRSPSKRSSVLNLEEEEE